MLKLREQPLFLPVHRFKLEKLTKMSNNSNNVHYSGVRFICDPDLSINLALASFGPIMTECSLQMNLTPSKWTLLLYS